MTSHSLADRPDLYYCEECNGKPGSPALCDRCLEARQKAGDAFVGHHQLSTEVSAPLPIPMILYCPLCHFKHVDVGEFATRVHHTHACQGPGCGLVWRPALVPTVGVEYLPGFKNDP